MITFCDVLLETKQNKEQQKNANKLSRVYSMDWKSCLKRFLFQGQLSTANILITTVPSLHDSNSRTHSHRD